EVGDVVRDVVLGQQGFAHLHGLLVVGDHHLREHHVGVVVVRGDLLSGGGGVGGDRGFGGGLLPGAAGVGVSGACREDQRAGDRCRDCQWGALHEVTFPY